MGFINKWLTRVKIPKFSVAVYGKLPCHKEYLHCGTDPAFVALKNLLDRGFDKRISAQEPRPHVLPDRRFYVAGKTDYAACLFESDDGIRGFPFLMAAPIPARLARQPLPIFWQALEHVWTYLEAYFADLRVQPDVNTFYNRVRNVVHELAPFVPETWPEPDSPISPERGQTALTEHLQTLVIPREDFSVANLVLAEKPAFILWPVNKWCQQVPGDTHAFFGTTGLSDLRVQLFRQDVVEMKDSTELGQEDAAAEGKEKPEWAVRVAEEGSASTPGSQPENQPEDEVESEHKQEIAPPFALPQPLRASAIEQDEESETQE